MSIEAMKQALEALEKNQPVNYCLNSYGEKSYLMVDDPFKFERNDKAITALRQALQEATLQEISDIGQEIEPVAWRNAAIRLGEELSSVGPDRYYDMTAGQWLDWALAQEPRGKNSLPAPPKQEIEQTHTDHPARHWDRTCPTCVSEQEQQGLQN
jgi:hypothetical protein